MFEQKVRVVSEGLARTMDRRKFLKGTGTTIFAGLAALAAGHALGSSAAASGKRPPLGGPQCAPPGPYCNSGGGPLSGCNGGACFQHLHNGNMLQCVVMYGWYQSGCWTTPVGNGYWTCCDCGCGPNGGSPLCGCAQHSSEPVPRPDGPGQDGGKRQRGR